MASPQWPAPMTTVVTFGTGTLQGRPDQATSTVMLVGLVMAS
jgi:hypothetical protein